MKFAEKVYKNTRIGEMIHFGVVHNRNPKFKMQREGKRERLSTNESFIVLLHEASRNKRIVLIDVLK